MKRGSEKERLNLYISPDLLRRLEYCAEKYGVLRAQLAVMLIGQGVAGIEKTFTLLDNLPAELLQRNDNLSKVDDK